jgi:DNA repair exonuclease SbcCD ATPase subunit
VTGRIIDADADALANIDRLTAQVETLKREVDQYEAQLQLERREGRELGLMYAGSNERLQESLTACEQERDATLHRVTVLEGAINGAKSELSNGEHEEAWKTLERVEKCSICSKSFTDCACTAEQKMQAWMDWYREVTTTTEVAEVVAPPAETPTACAPRSPPRTKRSRGCTRQ